MTKEELIPIIAVVLAVLLLIASVVWWLLLIRNWKRLNRKFRVRDLARRHAWFGSSRAQLIMEATLLSALSLAAAGLFFSS